MQLLAFSVLLPLGLSAVLPKSNLDPKPVSSCTFARRLLNFLPMSVPTNSPKHCNHLYDFFAPELDSIFEILTGLEGSPSYKKSSDELQTEIRKVYKYFKLEMNYRGSNEPFTLDSFFLMIQNRTGPDSTGKYFSNPKVANSYKKDNIEACHRLFPEYSEAAQEESTDFGIFPHFPQLSLILFKRLSSLDVAYGTPIIFDHFSGLSLISNSNGTVLRVNLYLKRF